MAVSVVWCRVRLLIRNDYSRVLKYSTLLSGVSLNQGIHNTRKLRHCRKFNTERLLADKTKSVGSGLDSSTSSSDSDGESDEENEDVTVEYCRGLPQVTVPLPSRKERCRFTLKPITNTVGDFLRMLREEDRGIDRVIVTTQDGIRIASSTSIETLLEEDFRLVINDNTYNVSAPKQERITQEEVQQLGDVKNMISRLYEALNVQEHQVQKERELCVHLETLQQELLPLEEKRAQIENVASRKTDWLAWAGLGLMSVQFGILARLTWWEYSWDIMEPVTYFVTYGTAMAAYAYFVLTRQEYILPEVKDRQYLVTLHKRAKKHGLDLTKYNQLKQQISKLELDLKRLRDPTKLHIPPKTTTTTTGAASGLNVKELKVGETATKATENVAKTIPAKE